MLGNFFMSADFFSKSNFSFRHNVRVSNSLDPFQARHVRPALGPNCLQYLPVHAFCIAISYQWRSVLQYILGQKRNAAIYEKC